MTVIHSKRASASNQPAHGTKRAAPGGVPLPTNSQTLVYFNQIREAAERGISVGPTAHVPHNASHGKGHKRRNERVAIDTFNITGERGNPLFKQEQANNSNMTSAHRANEEGVCVQLEKKDLAKIMENEAISAPQSVNIN